MERSDWLNNFIKNYQTLGVNNFEQLTRIYDANIQFIDPLHKVEGIAPLMRYFEQLYTHVDSCHFVVEHSFEMNENTQNSSTPLKVNEAAIYWTMTYTHHKLNKNQPITVEGHSHLKATNGLVFYHQDFLDVGAMLYEHIPLVGGLIKYIKKRASQ